MNRVLLSIVTVLLVLLFHYSVLADYEFHAVTNSDADSENCRIAANSTGDVAVTWTEGERVYSRIWSEGTLGDITDHGVGAEPTVAWTEEGFWLAWVDASGLWVRRNAGGGWDEGLLIVPEYGSPLYAPCLTGDTPPHESDVLYLSYSDEGMDIWFMARFDEAWLDVAPMPIASDVDAWSIPRSRGVMTGSRAYFYYSTDSAIYYVDANSEEVGEPNTLAGAFAVACDPDNVVHVLSNGIQPTCFCNSMLHTYREFYAYPPVDWSMPEDLTYYYDQYTWPHDPAIACDSEGVVHACWSQEHYNGAMQFTFRGIFYYTKEDGVWSAQTDLLAGHGHMARDSDMALGKNGKPVFVFAKDEMPGFNVWLALDRGTTGVPEPAPGALRLSAYPNPFNPETTISFESSGGYLLVTVHDICGRRLRTLFDGYSNGELTLDWNGCNDAGQEQSSGIYLIRAHSASGGSQMKLALIR
ncbi:MAG: T9SS type A sorting domain-containing protein [bacterium]|nr:T9SS type A sorting domain-containing protein [bacterium]